LVTDLHEGTMSDADLNHLIEMLLSHGIRGSNAELAAAIRFAESQGYTFAKPARD
jgi:hypothetical protein